MATTFQRSTQNPATQKTWLHHALWITGITLLGLELGFGIDYLCSLLSQTSSGLFAWSSAFSMMAWTIVDQATWHASSFHAAVRALPLSSIPFALIGAAVFMSRRASS